MKDSNCGQMYKNVKFHYCDFCEHAIAQDDMSVMLLYWGLFLEYACCNNVLYAPFHDTLWLQLLYDLYDCQLKSRKNVILCFYKQAKTYLCILAKKKKSLKSVWQMSLCEPASFTLHKSFE